MTTKNNREKTLKNDNYCDIEALKKEIHDLKTKLNISNTKYRVAMNNEKKLYKTIESLKKEKDSIINLYNEDLLYIENELYKISNEYEKLKKLERENKILKNKYDSLSKSKLGKITLKYWELKRERKLNDDNNR